MRALLLSGLGSTFKNSAYLDGSLFGTVRSERTRAMLACAGVPDFRLEELSVVAGRSKYPLMRAPDDTPHLTTFTLESILGNSRHDFRRIALAAVWADEAPSFSGELDVVLLSTTYIWSRAMLAAAMKWIGKHFSSVPIVVGGQYTNLKFKSVMQRYRAVTAVVRGDGEIALPSLLDALEDHRNLSSVPNLAWRDGDEIRTTAIEYLDLDTTPSPTLPHRFRIAPYESMRGCPFDCKFCSFPAASPKWRYKSAEKIRDDWVSYRADNGVSIVDAMDSTFTVPLKRLRTLMEILPAADIPSWACYSRADILRSHEMIEGLLGAGCFYVVIGFESMNEDTLRRMSKRVSAAQNRRAFELLAAHELGYTINFIVGYPGEDETQFEDTRRFLIDEYSGYFMLHQFSISDETMPLWEDRDELAIRVIDPEDPDSGWSHRGMTSDDARRFQKETLDAIRHKNDVAVPVLWQRNYAQPLLPTGDTTKGLAVEKAVDRLAMAPFDYADIDRGAAEITLQLERLARLGVEYGALSGAPRLDRP